MRIVLLLIFGIISLGAQSQLRYTQDEFLEINKQEKERTHYIQIDGLFYGYSDVLTNDLLNQAGDGSQIGEDTKQSNYKNLDQNNVLGSEVMGSITYKLNKGEGNLVFRLRDRAVAYSYFNEDFFKLFTSGNKQFEGQKVEISPYEYFKLNYVSAYIGYETTVDDKWNIGGGLSYMKSVNSKVINMKNAYVYTAPYGEYIEISGQFHTHSSGKEGSHYARNYGNGFGADFYVSRSFDKGNKLSFSMEDLGVIFTTTMDEYYDVDTTIRFEGVDINNTSDGNTFGVSTNIEDMLGLENEPEQTKYVVPAIFHLNYTHPLSSKISVESGVRYLLLAHQLPQFYARGNFLIKEFLMVSPVIAYGGFSSFDLGLTLGAKVGDFMNVNLDFFYIESLVLPASSSTQGLGLTVSSFF